MSEAGGRRSGPELLRAWWGLFRPPPARDAVEREAFRENLGFAVWSGLSTGVVLLTDVILAKTLAVPGWQVTLLTTLTPAANLVSFYWTAQVHGRPKASFFLLAGLMGRLPLALLLLWRSSGWMIALNFFYAVSTALLATASNTLYQRRYREETRAHRFGVAASVTAFFSILAIMGAGFLLERHEQLYPWIFAFAGVTGFMGTYHLYRMEAGPGGRRDAAGWLLEGADRLRDRLRPAPGAVTAPGFADSLRLARRVMRENPQFMRFERNFMIYGFAFLSVFPVLPLYVVRHLNMNYHQLSAAKGLWALVGQVVLSPVLGVALGRQRPLRFTGKIFLVLALYPFLLLVSTGPDVPGRVYWVYAAFLCYSVAMAGVSLSWTLGSMHFAGEEDASAFQGIHVALTGVRGLLAPSLGFGLYALAGPAAVFALSTALFLVAGFLMLRQAEGDMENPAGTAGAAVPVGASPAGES